MSDTDNEDIKRAIAMSMEDLSPGSRRDTSMDASGSDDEDLKTAIAMSKQQITSSPQNKAKIVIDLVSDDDDDGDDDLNAPVTARRLTEVQTVKTEEQRGSQNSAHSESKITAISLRPASSQAISAASISPQGEKIKEEHVSQSSTPSIQIQAKIGNPQKSQPSASSSVLGGMNRKQMEEERIARAERRKKLEEEKKPKTSAESKKRKDPYSPPRQDHSKRQKEPEAPVNLTSMLHHPDVMSFPDTKSNETEAVTPSTSTAQQTARVPQVLSYKEQIQTVGASGMQYPDGVVKKTWVNGCPRVGDDIKIEEVLQKDDLELALLSSYLIDPEWVMSKIGEKTKVIMVLHSKDEEEASLKDPYANFKQKQALRIGSDENYKFCFPSLEGQINCMHSKLQILAHPSYLRIVVPSGNLMPYDWGETGIMENVCFLIDLPRLPNGQKTETTPFGTELVYFLQAQGLEQNVINSISKFDFSRTANLAFIHTIGGSHGGIAWKRTGYCGLGTAVQKLGLQTEEALNIDFVVASIGNITENFIKCMVLAAKGDDGSTEYVWRTDKPSSRDKAVSETQRKLSDEVKSRCRIYFPTRETVARSRGGAGSGATICLQSRWFDASTFPRSLFRDCKSVREGVLMHNKIIFVRPEKPNGRAWAYVGSANLSESAWGRLTKDKATKQPKLNCRNWECGVVFAVPAESTSTSSSARYQGPVKEASDHGDEGMTMDAFQGYVPVPMGFPGEVYGARRPWFYSE